MRRVRNNTWKGLHYHTTTVRQKKIKIRQIANLIHQNSRITPLTACKIIVQKNAESRSRVHTYLSWWNKRATYLSMKNNQYNASGQGRKRTPDRQKLFEQVGELFEFYRYQFLMPMRLSDVGDLFIKSAQYLQTEYNPDHAYEDAKAWKKHADANDCSLNSKIKYKPDYIVAKDAEN